MVRCAAAVTDDQHYWLAESVRGSGHDCRHWAGVGRRWAVGTLQYLHVELGERYWLNLFGEMTVPFVYCVKSCSPSKVCIVTRNIRRISRVLKCDRFAVISNYGTNALIIPGVLTGPAVRRTAASCAMLSDEACRSSGFGVTETEHWRPIPLRFSVSSTATPQQSSSARHLWRNT